MVRRRMKKYDQLPEAVMPTCTIREVLVGQKALVTGAGFAAHKKTPHFEKTVATAGNMFAETPTETLCNSVWPPDDRWK